MKPLSYRHIALLFLFSGLLSGLSTRAQDKIVTDRPTETDSPNTVSVRHFQAENDFEIERESGNVMGFLPQTLLRAGITRNLELRSEIRLLTSDSGKPGLLPLRAGIKYHLLDERGLLPETAVQAMVQIPWMADHRYIEPNYEPECRFLFKNSVTDKLEFEYNLGLLWQAHNRRPEYVYAVAGSLELNKKLSVFTEEYCFAPAGHHARHTINSGVLYLLSRNLQLDLSAGSGLNHYAPHFFARAGVAFLI